MEPFIKEQVTTEQDYFDGLGEKLRLNTKVILYTHKKVVDALLLKRCEHLNLLEEFVLSFFEHQKSYDAKFTITQSHNRTIYYYETIKQNIKLLQIESIDIQHTRNLPFVYYIDDQCLNTIEEIITFLSS